MKYNVVFKNKKFVIKELKTNYFIKAFSEKKQAWKLCTKLNKKGAFEGETPHFFALKL